jgi:hypothetical protein
VYTSRADHDKDGSSTPARPTGDAYWLGESPLEVTAGSWDRWIVSDMSFPIPPPPEYMSAEHIEGLNAVYEAALARSSEQGAMVNFWGGVPGTEAPAGIWQNRLYNVTKDSGLTDVEYAEAQKILAQALADSFMECWKSKYTYWTKRPSMVRSDIQLAMDNPRFPSYVSGHSTISRTAAEVLTALFPEYSETWYKDAEVAKNSRLWAGIHYPYDNENGAALGHEIGAAIVAKLQLNPIQ